MDYKKILEMKQFKNIKSGFEIEQVNKYLFDFQKDIVKWALRKGRCALFEDTGLGKTLQQLSWADEVNKHTKKPVLILAPLAVAKQTIHEGNKFEIKVNLCESDKDVINGINITNYDKIHRFDTSKFVGIVLDESSILKSYTGATTNDLIDRFINTPYKLCCTATPSPNDYTELGTTAEFLGIMKRKEMLSMFFINDASHGDGWRLKGHSEMDFYKWIGTWAMMIKKPSNLGYQNDGYDLPQLNINYHIVESKIKDNSLFVELAETLTERREVRKESLTTRINKVKEIIDLEPLSQFLIWCDYNDESDALRKTINGSIEVKGSDKPEHKEKALIGFANNEFKYLVSKPSIAGYGMNWQNCNNMIFAGLSDSYEKFYQAIRRCWRFGQKNEVNVHVILSEAEINVLNNIKEKERKHQEMSNRMIELLEEIMKNELKNNIYSKTTYEPKLKLEIPSWL